MVNIEFRGRLVVSPPEGDEWAQTVAVYRAPARDRLPDADHIARLGNQYQELGFDSALVNQRSSYADPFVTATWAAAATSRLKLAIAHRVGLQAPTAAARALASVDRMSGGRAAIHVIQGSTDEDMQRDGDFLPKPERYRRAGEYMQIFRREMTALTPFDFSGDFYRVKDAWSAVRPVQSPMPEISAAGASEEGLEFCAAHADVYAMMGEPVATTAPLIDGIARRAATRGRTLRFWRDCNFIMARSDEDAWHKAEAIERTISGAGGKYTMWEAGKGDATAAPQSVAHQRALAESSDPRDRTLFHAAARATGGAAGPAFVGSPKTVARAILDFQQLGIEIFTLGAPIATAEDRALLLELMDRMREGAARITRQ